MSRLFKRNRLKLSLVAKFRQKIAGVDEHTRDVVVRSSASLLVRLIGIVATLAVSVTLGRALGPRGLGIISLSSQITTLLLAVTVLGMDTVLVKHVAIGYEKGDFQEVASSIHTAGRINGILAAVITILGVVWAQWLSLKVFHEPRLWIPLVIFIAALAPQTFSRIYAAGLSGVRKVWQSNLVNHALSMCVVGIGLLVLYSSHLPVNVITVAALYGVGRLAAFCFVAVYWKKSFPYKGPRQFIPRPMLTTALPLLVASTAYLISSSADGIMLGWLKTPYEVGLYSVAARLALMEILFLMASTSAIAPKLAHLYAERKLAELQQFVKRVSLGLVIVGAASLVVIITYGRPILSLWGHAFTHAYLLLVILGIGQFFSIATGCSGVLLSMCGHEKDIGYIAISSLVTNVILNYFLIQAWGAAGAAASTALTMLGANLAETILVKRRIGVSLIPLLPA